MGILHSLHHKIAPFFWPPYTFRYIFKPYNVLKIRNCPRTYTDPDWRTFHAAMSVMCRFVEGEFDGNAGYCEYVKWVEEEWKKDEEQRKAEPNHFNIPEGQYKTAVKTLELYNEYTNTDWDGDCEDLDDEKMSRMMKIVAEIYRGWWT